MLFRAITLIAFLLTLGAPPRPAVAQAYPQKPLHLIVPFAAGGSPDVIARMIGEELGGALGQNVVIENRAGAGGNIAAQYVLDQPADGTTLFPGTAIKQVGGIKIGFIGMTLKETATLVSPSGVTGLNFTDEAATANALVPGLKSAGASTIVLLIHQGASVTVRYDDPACPGLAGDILPVMAKLDPAIRG